MKITQIRRRFITRSPHSQRGVVLVMALIILLMVTMISISTMQTTIQEEKMAGNVRDRDRSFQAAEAAVQFCLNEISKGTVAYTTSALTPSTTATPNWDDTDITATNNKWKASSTDSHEVTMNVSGLSSNPRCMVEALGTAGSYRVTGRAVGGSADTIVMLQATYSPE